VRICAVCGYEGGQAFRFCPECGTTAGASGSEQRKVVTVLFCDVVGSTALGESTDPETLRALLARYFERMKQIVERHEGTVEKFIGDAVMAVFGVPLAHEDDTLRACRAAVEMREAFPDLGVEGRTGVTTGEVVTGTEERLVTGDAVNVAARLQQAAQPGEVLIGEPALALVRGAVEVEAVEPLTLKGKAEPVPAYRLLSAEGAAERHDQARFVGREQELALIQAAWERARSERRCELTTIIGEAGVGKSRLVAEALALIGARVVQGRCLPYGEGITYWPVIEVIKQLDAVPSDPVAAAAIRSLLGETPTAATAEEIAWAFRKLLEEQAPLIVVFDDLQWGEETFLDLLEHVALLSSGAPLLLLCMARPDFVDRRPAWAVTLRLEPLPQDAVDELIGGQVAAELRGRIARAAGGNPLFVAEMLAMAEQADFEVAVPPTLRALLAARLDQLESPERRVLERGAVEGEVFHRGAVQALAPEETQVTPRLAALARKELIRPDKAQLPGEDGFRFRHLLLRDTAYEALPKSTRAELHERFAVWLEERGRQLVELDELVGYHLEQAARYKAELGQAEAALAERAGERLARAGRRALWRGDEPTAAVLLERALKLTRPIRLDVVLEIDLTRAHRYIAPQRSAEIADRAADRAHAVRDHAGEALARAVAAFYRTQLSPELGFGAVEALARAALPPLERTGDHAALVHVWDVLGFGVANNLGRYEEHAHAAEQALHHARAAGEQRRDLFYLDYALALGPEPADDALRELDRALPESPHPCLLLTRGWLLAMLARFDEAAAVANPALERWHELTGGGANGRWMMAQIATLAGDHGVAAHHLRRTCEWLDEHGQRGFLSTFAPGLGRSLCSLGQHEEAFRWARLGRDLGEEHDVATQMLWRQVEARVRARRGEHSQAEVLAREAVAISDRTDALNWQGDALCDLAEVLGSAGRAEDARAALEQALEPYERKRNVAMVEQTRARLAELRSPAFPAERP
jgi:class 3 adenylate cyclase